MSADARLRRDIRLLGDVLGRVLVEQEGQELLDAEERIRLLSRQAREGAPREELREAVRGLELKQQASIIRAFAIYFQLVNIAEQHHRLRRRREYELEQRVPRESLRDAFSRLGDRPAPSLSLELVLTAHPTEATRRTVLGAHVRISRLLGELDDPLASPARAEAIAGALTGEVTLLWQTDEVRAVRPRVVDEIRHGLWFFEQSLLGEAPRELAHAGIGRAARIDHTRRARAARLLDADRRAKRGRAVPAEAVLRLVAARERRVPVARRALSRSRRGRSQLACPPGRADCRREARGSPAPRRDLRFSSCEARPPVARVRNPG